ncbi:MAG: choloylglycine hydrolase [Clostridiales bacterium]|nr:choloylglycine hydrolase [Clostridiales bacterium]
MCTAIKFVSEDFFFGRTLDNDCSYGEEVIITPRRKRFSYRDAGTVQAHYAFIGVGCVIDDYPMYYDAVNEKGLAMAGLRFAGNAVYNKVQSGKDNIAQFELIPWLLGGCATVPEAKRALSRMNFTDTPFKPELPVSPLHWIIADKHAAITVESTATGLHVYDNPVGVLTNNPPFPEQLFNLNNYMSLSPRPPKNEFSKKLNLTEYSRGMGALGLPGDLSSQSRFVRAAFTALNSTCCKTCDESVNQFFHILGTVEQTRGCCVMENGEYEVTIYTSCMDADKGIVYYTSYDNSRITAVDMHKENIDGTAIIRYPFLHGETIFMQN